MFLDPQSILLNKYVNSEYIQFVFYIYSIYIIFQKHTNEWINN